MKETVTAICFAIYVAAGAVLLDYMAQPGAKIQWTEPPTWWQQMVVAASWPLVIAVHALRGRRV